MKLHIQALLIVAVVYAAGFASRLSLAGADRSDSVKSPVPPKESLSNFEVPPGLQVELVAAEPDISSPVAMRFDEDNRLWVAQMRDYPTALPNGPHSRISILEDHDQDGYFEHSTVFADNLNYVTGVQPWRGGVIVTMAGRVAFMKDTDGDGQVDVDETWFTGFAEQNTQLRANHPTFAIDNHIYIANGLRGGTIVDPRRPEAKAVSISGMDFRFDPLTGANEAVSGVGQFGLTFDDGGNRFVCTNRNPAVHVVIEDRYLKKNPLVAVSSITSNVAMAGESSRVYPIAKSWTTSSLHAGQFTAACGVHVYRGDALPRKYYGNIFVCEPTGHLVHREVMSPCGATFVSKPAEEGREFFASHDAWSCPVNLELGPDGAMYVVDMYRAVIEHPEWMPNELRNRPDLRDGSDRGRIYRVVPKNFQRRPIAKLSKSTSSELVGHLASPNAWWRETAARLILERQDKTVILSLRDMAANHDWPLARIHALRLLEGLDGLDEPTLMRLLKDPDPDVVCQAIEACEPKISESKSLLDQIELLATHDDPRVRFKALLTATPLPVPPTHPADAWELQAMLVATGDKADVVLTQMLCNPAKMEANVPDPSRFVGDLAHLAAAAAPNHVSLPAIKELVKSERYGRLGLVQVFAEAARSGVAWADILKSLETDTRDSLLRLLIASRRDAGCESCSSEERCEAIDLISFSGDEKDGIARLALHGSPPAVRMKAIAALTKFIDDESWIELYDSFPNETPAVKTVLLDVATSNRQLAKRLLDAIEGGTINATQIDAAHRASMVESPDDEIQQRSRRLLEAAMPADRERALAEYRPALTLRSDPVRGRDIFSRQCASCHQIDGIGVSFAPDISDSREKSREQLLTDILQPNRAVDSNYFSYTVVTNSGSIHTGILAAETSTSITLKQQEGKSVTLRRDEIEDLYSNAVSMMPDGLEQLIPQQDMADLISFIKNWRYSKDGEIRASDAP